MWEFMRKLTAGYTEAEYQEYLNEPEDRTNFYEVMQPNGDYLFVPKSEFEPVKELPKLGVVHSMKDIANEIAEVADDTGYDPGLLMDFVVEYVKDGCTYKEAFDSVTAISYEHDW